MNLEVFWSLTHDRGRHFPQAAGEGLLFLKAPRLIWHNDHPMCTHCLDQVCELIITDALESLSLPGCAHASCATLAGTGRLLPHGHSLHGLLEDRVPKRCDGPKVFYTV
eukprot:Skav217609  [mRNA]  locus=scaffold2172:237741:238067:- [translate_table: standard]